MNQYFSSEPSVNDVGLYEENDGGGDYNISEVCPKSQIFLFLCAHGTTYKCELQFVTSCV